MPKMSLRTGSPDVSNFRDFTLNLDFIACFRKQNSIFDCVKVSFRKRNLWLDYSHFQVTGVQLGNFLWFLVQNF